MLDDMQISISRTEEGSLIGKVVKINENKYVKFFVEEGDSWIQSVRRVSNSEFRIIEKKIGSALFGSYGLDTNQEYKVVFIDENTIGLGSNSKKPEKSTIKYKRVVN